MEGIASRNRPYVFNGVGDCYGYIRQVWNAILYDGKAHEEDYAPGSYNKKRWIRRGDPYLPVADYPSSDWAKITNKDELMPGDVLDASRRDGLNGAYVRKWHSGFQYYYVPIHEKLKNQQKHE